ncbi:hypothetical protein [Brevibacillus laterosporus]|uniref:hypothetical protein n=1 Tax=Brevibacillus laterosporus TaxID=1465 RepID=UPI003D1E420F
MDNQEVFLKDVYIYKVSDKQQLQESIPEITSLDFKRDIWRRIEFLSKINEIEAFLHFDLVWISVSNSRHLNDKVKKLEEFCGNYLRPFKTTHKTFIDFLFKNDFSDNLMEIEIERENIYDIFDRNLFVGSCINYTSTYKKIIDDEKVRIVYSKLQPCNSRIPLTLRGNNLINFNKNIHFNDAIKILDILQDYISDYEGDFINENSSNI